MCGRYTQTQSVDQLVVRFDAPVSDRDSGGESPDGTVVWNRPRFNIAPTQMVAVVTERLGDGEGDDGDHLRRRRRLEPMRWGLIPSWAKDEKGGAKMINARSETVAENGTFKRLLTARRCLIPADGFFEWQPQPAAEGAKKPQPPKQPFHFHLKDRGLYGFAGLYDVWKDPDGQWLRSCTILTTDANAVVSPVHDRMPVILRPEDENWWLDPTVKDLSVLGLLQPYPADRMEAIPVSPAVNRVTVDDPSLLEPITLLPMNSA